MLVNSLVGNRNHVIPFPSERKHVTVVSVTSN